MTEYYSIVNMYQIFFVHASVGKHLGCIHVLAIINSALVKIRVHVSLRTVVFSCPVVRLLVHMLDLFLVFF